MNAANAAKLAPRLTQVQAGQPCSRPNASGVTSSAIATVSRATPGRSRGAAPPRRARGSRTAAPASAATPTGTFTQKIDRHPEPSTSAAMSGPPSAWPTTALPDMARTRTLSARARARPSKLIWIPVSTCGTMTAAQAPCAIRAPISAPVPGARPQASEASVNPARPARYMRR